MTTSDEAVLAIRHVVQEHGDEGTVLGNAFERRSVRWFGQLLNWDWPETYVEVLARHDGVMVLDAIVFSFLRSIECFMFLHEGWHRPDGYWPVGSDGCGNYYALAMGQRTLSGECPVVFFESRWEEPEIVAENYADFMVGRMRDQCQEFGCSELG